MNRSEQITELAAALCKFQGEVKAIKMDKEAKVKYKDRDGNWHEKNYKYASLGAIFESIRKPLCANGLSIVQVPSTMFIPTVPVQVDVTVETTVLHSTSGQWVSSTIVLRTADAKVQSVGSAVTYARRYGLSPALGLSTEEDDDGAGANNGHGDDEPKKQRSAPQTGPAKPATGQPPATSRPPAQKAPDKPTDEAQAAAGLIRAPEVDFLGNLAAEKKISPAQMAVWLMGIYGLKNRWQIKAGSQYKTIVEYIRDCSEEIKNYGVKKTAERQPGED